MPKPTQKDLFLHRSEPGHGHGPPSPEQMQAMFAKWNAWKEKFKDSIVDWGDRLKSEGKIVSTSGVSDGPFVEAKEIMRNHVAYWTEKLSAGRAVVFGPVADPKGGWGLGVVLAANLEEVRAFEAQDPAVTSGRGFRYEILPMLRAVY